MEAGVFSIVSARAKLLREKRSIPVDQMAEQIGVSANSLNRFESAAQRIELDKLVCLVNVLGVPMTSLFMLEDKKS